MKTISFIIPVYNEESRLNKTFEALRVLVMPLGLKLESVIFVDDGSTDATAAKLKTENLKLKKILNAGIKIISYPKNRGKGYAIRQGMIAANSDYNLFFDADMSTPLTELKKFVPFMDQNIDVIIGTRKNGESTVIKHQPFIREKLGRCFTLMTQIVLNTWVTDFTCGFKAFSRQSKDKIFPICTIDRWGYDAEVIFLARKMGFSMHERSVLWANNEGTKVKLSKAIPQTLSELARIRLNHRLLTPLSSFKLNLGPAK